MLSGEREHGTLAMLLSQPISQQSLVFSKALARAVMLLIVTLGFLCLGAYFADIQFGMHRFGRRLVLSALIISWLLFGLARVSW